jgi:hypothetical protein
MESAAYVTRPIAVNAELLPGPRRRADCLFEDMAGQRCFRLSLATLMICLRRFLAQPDAPRNISIRLVFYGLNGMEATIL